MFEIFHNKIFLRKKIFKRKVPIGCGKVDTSNLTRAISVSEISARLEWVGEWIGKGDAKSILLFDGCCVREEGGVVTGGGKRGMLG